MMDTMLRGSQKRLSLAAQQQLLRQLSSFRRWREESELERVRTLLRLTASAYAAHRGRPVAVWQPGAMALRHLLLQWYVHSLTRPLDAWTLHRSKAKHMRRVAVAWGLCRMTLVALRFWRFLARVELARVGMTLEAARRAHAQCLARRSELFVVWRRRAFARVKARPRAASSARLAPTIARASLPATRHVRGVAGARSAKEDRRTEGSALSRRTAYVAALKETSAKIALLESRRRNHVVLFGLQRWALAARQRSRVQLLLHLWSCSIVLPAFTAWLRVGHARRRSHDLARRADARFVSSTARAACRRWCSRCPLRSALAVRAHAHFARRRQREAYCAWRALSTAAAADARRDEVGCRQRLHGAMRAWRWRSALHCVGAQAWREAAALAQRHRVAGCLRVLIRRQRRLERAAASRLALQRQILVDRWLPRHAVLSRSAHLARVAARGLQLRGLRRWRGPQLRRHELSRRVQRGYDIGRARRGGCRSPIEMTMCTWAAAARCHSYASRAIQASAPRCRLRLGLAAWMRGVLDRAAAAELRRRAGLAGMVKWAARTAWALVCWQVASAAAQKAALARRLLLRWCTALCWTIWRRVGRDRTAALACARAVQRRQRVRLCHALAVWEAAAQAPAPAVVLASLALALGTWMARVDAALVALALNSSAVTHHRIVARTRGLLGWRAALLPLPSRRRPSNGRCGEHAKRRLAPRRLHHNAEA